MIRDMCGHRFLCVLQNNVMVFIAELFWWFESVKPEFVRPRELQEIRDGKFITLFGSYLNPCNICCKSALG